MTFSPHHTSSHLTTSDNLTISHITSRKKRTQRRSSWAEFLGRIDEISPHHTSHIIASHQTSDIASHPSHHKPKEENTKKKFLGRVLGPDRRNLTTSHITHHCISPDIRHHISPHRTSQAERREHKEEVLAPENEHRRSRSAETSKKYEFYCENVVQEHPRTTKSTRITTKNEHRRSCMKSQKSTRITTRNPFRTLSRASRTHEKYENYHEK